MSPLESEDDFGNSKPCRHLIITGTVATCAIYRDRPQQCADHDFPSRYCPIGRDALGIKDHEGIDKRIGMMNAIAINNETPEMRNAFCRFTKTEATK
jgi:Fe-S-cluster containining protein